MKTGGMRGVFKARRVACGEGQGCRFGVARDRSHIDVEVYRNESN